MHTPFSILAPTTPHVTLLAPALVASNNVVDLLTVWLLPSRPDDYRYETGDPAELEALISQGHLSNDRESSSSLTGVSGLGFEATDLDVLDLGSLGLGENDR